MKVPNQTKTLLISGVIARSQDIGKEIVTNFSVSGAFTSLTNIKKNTCYFIIEYSLLTGEGNGTPLQYSCLENPMDGGAW